MPVQARRRGGWWELPLPLTRAELAARVVTTCIVAALVLGVSRLAIAHLVSPGQSPAIALVASTAWLGLVVFMVVGFLVMEGVRRTIVSVLGLVSRDHFVQVRPGEGDEARLRHGFRLLGIVVPFDVVPLGQVRAVSWTLGQASGRIGEDLDDWSIVLWHASPLPRDGASSSEGHLIVSPERARATIEPLGLTLVDFLREAGVPLVAEEETRFVRDELDVVDS